MRARILRIIAAGRFAGSIGLGRGPGAAKDEACATADLAKLADQLK